MARKIQLRRDTAANWTSTNPVLAQGEVGVDLTNVKIKIGNGTASWTTLPYFDDKETDFAGYATTQYVDNEISNIVIPTDVNGLTDVTNLLAVAEKTFVVTAAANPGTPPPNNIYRIGGVNRPVLTLVRGGVYTFDQSAASNTNHPIAFRDSANAAFTAGVVSTGVPGTAGAQTVFTVPANAPDDLRYYCTVHGNGMGNTISVTGSTGTVDLSAITQNIVPATNVAYDLGSATHRFRDLFLSGTTIDLGGSTLSNVGGEIQFSGGIRTNTTSTGVVGFTRGSDFNTVYATASFDPIGPYPEGLAILDVGPPLQGAYLYVPAVYDPILDANDFLIGIALISPGSSYEGTDQMLAQGTASATSAFVLQGGQTAGVSASVPLNPVGGILGSYSATITHDGQTLTVNYTVGGVGETIATVTSFSQTGGFDAAWAEDNDYFHITRFAETVLVPVIYLPPGEVTPVQPAGNQIAIFVKWNTFQETLPTSNVLGQVALAGTTTPIDISDLTDTTGLIPADIGDLTDTGSLLSGGQIPGPHADDSAAAAAGVAIGFTYHKTGTGGQVFVRLV